MASSLMFDIKCYRYKELKSYCKFIPKDVCEVDGVTFVRIDPRCRNLIAVVAEKNKSVPVKLPHFSLTQSTGLVELKHMRAEAQKAELRTIVGEAKCSLFADEDGVEQKPKKLHRRIATACRVQHNTASICVSVVGDKDPVRMLRSGKPTGVLWVEYDSAALDAVITTIRDGDFVPDKRSHCASGAAGIWCGKSGSFIATWKDMDGKKRFKTCNDLDTAVAMQSNNLETTVDEIDELAATEVPELDGHHEAGSANENVVDSYSSQVGDMLADDNL
jgi:hypothetical protein